MTSTMQVIKFGCFPVIVIVRALPPRLQHYETLPSTLFSVSTKPLHLDHVPLFRKINVV